VYVRYTFEQDGKAGANDGVLVLPWCAVSRVRWRGRRRRWGARCGSSKAASPRVERCASPTARPPAVRRLVRGEMARSVREKTRLWWAAGRDLKPSCGGMTPDFWPLQGEDARLGVGRGGETYRGYMGGSGARWRVRWAWGGACGGVRARWRGLVEKRWDREGFTPTELGRRGATPHVWGRRGAGGSDS
jgi:hypothetical protein